MSFSQETLEVWKYSTACNKPIDVTWRWYLSHSGTTYLESNRILSLKEAFLHARPRLGLAYDVFLLFYMQLTTIL